MAEKKATRVKRVSKPDQIVTLLSDAIVLLEDLDNNGLTEWGIIATRVKSCIASVEKYK